jgi:hypothetical protein
MQGNERETTSNQITQIARKQFIHLSHKDTQIDQQHNEAHREREFLNVILSPRRTNEYPIIEKTKTTN